LALLDHSPSPNYFRLPADPHHIVRVVYELGLMYWPWDSANNVENFVASIEETMVALGWKDHCGWPFHNSCLSREAYFSLSFIYCEMFFIIVPMIGNLNTGLNKLFANVRLLGSRFG
jgi:hypothetical protein